VTQSEQTFFTRIRSAVTAAVAKLLPGAGPPAPEPEAPKRYPWEDSYPASIDWRAEIPVKPVTDILDSAVAEFPDKPCLEFMGKRYDYKTVASLVDRAAKGLQDRGIGPGDCVGLLLPNCPYYVIFYYAILRLGATVVNYNPLYAKREIARQIIDSNTRVMVTLNLKMLYPKIEGRLEDSPLESIVICRMREILPFPSSLLFAFARRKEIAVVPNDDQHVPFERLIDNKGGAVPATIDPHEDVAVLQYTGGTTGTPKGAMLTHANLYANAVQTSLWSGTATRGEEKFLGVLPLFHVFGMTGVMNTCLYFASELILLPRFNTADVLEVIDEQKPTVFCGVPTMFSAINAHPDLEKYDLSSLKLCISGGAPLSLQIKEKFEALSGCSLVEGYGLTESSPVCTVNPFQGVSKLGSVGLPLPGTVIDIVDRTDPDKLLGPGEHGEICISGPQVMAGYLNKPGENADVLRGARLRTGDVGYLDEDGYLFIIDRIKDLILSGGFNVYPRMVEEAIHLHPAVEETVVCGVPHSHRGEIVKAFVKLKPGAELTSAELRGFLKENLASFEMPSKIEFRDELPKTLIGKPSRQALVAEEARRRTENDPATDELQEAAP
jgi:long-chain acyl-CoA synthetase